MVRSWSGTQIHRHLGLYLKVSFLIFSLTSQGPLETYSKKVFAGSSVTPRSIFHTLCLRVGSYARDI